MSRSKVAPSEQLSMVIDPHRHLSHFGAEGVNGHRKLHRSWSEPLRVDSGGWLD